ncbi:MAG: succinate dehydrogenase, hydrophobic membrane anchor protein [Gammaproteobacteria bacterium]|nr:succinate dehydrogenase, hydrophobic membrane anchor protein [Gammaproteobacteria bacterium]
MVKSVTSLGRSGLHDWLWQRVSAVVIASYVLFMGGYFATHASVDFAAWQALFQNTAFKLFTLVFLVGLSAHAWIGLWTVATDYVKPVKIRFVLQSAVIIASVMYFLWGVQVIWSV